MCFVAGKTCMYLVTGGGDGMPGSVEVAQSPVSMYIFMSPPELRIDKKGYLLHLAGREPHLTDAELPKIARGVLMSRASRCTDLCRFELMQKSRQEKLMQQKEMRTVNEARLLPRLHQNGHGTTEQPSLRGA